MLNLGFYNTSSTRTHVRFIFSTHAAAGANVAPNSAFENSDIRIYKATDGAAHSATQRSSSNGITMTSPFDSLTGVHEVDIDLTDNTDASFYVAGFYTVVLAPDETVDSQAITGIVLAVFEIGPLPVNVTHFGGTAGTFSSGRPEVNATHLAGTSQTGRDIGASVLLSSGTGTGQLKLASGYVAPNWGDVGNPTTTNNLSGTTVKTATDVEADTQDIQGRIPAALGANGNIKADLRDSIGVAVTSSGGRPEVNTSHLAGTSQTGRDIGASVLLSNGTGAGQVKIASGYLAMTWADIAAPTTTVNLSGTTIKTATDVETKVDTLLARITSGLFTGITSLAQWLGLLGGKQVGNTTARTELRATGAGSGTFDETTDSLEAVRDLTATLAPGTPLALTSEVTEATFNDD